jgi:hypothetical protein
MDYLPHKVVAAEYERGTLEAFWEENGRQIKENCKNGTIQPQGLYGSRICWLQYFHHGSGFYLSSRTDFEIVPIARIHANPLVWFLPVNVSITAANDQIISLKAFVNGKEHNLKHEDGKFVCNLPEYKPYRKIELKLRATTHQGTFDFFSESLSMRHELMAHLTENCGVQIEKETTGSETFKWSFTKGKITGSVEKGRLRA